MSQAQAQNVRRDPHSNAVISTDLEGYQNAKIRKRVAHRNKEREERMDHLEDRLEGLETNLNGMNGKLNTILEAIQKRT